MNSQYFAALLAFVGAVLFSAKAILVKLAYAVEVDVNAINLLVLRMGMAVPIYFLILWFSERKQKTTPLTKKQIWSIVLAGIGGYYLASLFDFLGLEYVSAGMERVILFVFPTIVVLISLIVYKRRVTGVQVAALLITYAGIFLAVYESIKIGNPTDVIIGCILVFLSALCYAAYLVGIGQLVHKVGTIRFTTYSMAVSAVCIVIHYLVTDRSNIIHFEPEVYSYALMMAVVSTVIPSFMVYEAIRRIGSSNAAIISGVGPVSTIVLAYFYLNETMGWLQIMGTLLVIAGVLLISVAKKKENVDN